MKKLFVALGVMVIIGCASKPEIVTVRSTVIPQPIKQAAVIKEVEVNPSITQYKNLTIIQGKTTKQEIFDVLGKPSNISIENDGSEFFSYSADDWDKSHPPLRVKLITKQGSVYEYILHRDNETRTLSIDIANNIVRSIHVY